MDLNPVIRDTKAALHHQSFQGMEPSSGIEPELAEYDTAVLPITLRGHVWNLVGLENFEISTRRLRADCSASELQT